MDVSTPSSPPNPTPRSETRPALLSVVCPAYNEVETLVAFHKALSKTMRRLDQPFEVVFVNDGSRDGTLALMRQLRATHPNTTIVDLSRNFGKEIAITAGLDHARGDAVTIMDADLQDPPELLEDFIEGWREGYDVVYAKRRTREGESWLKKTTASLFYKLMASAGSAPLPENVGDYRLMSRKAVDAICAFREHHRMMKGVFAWAGFPSKSVLFDRPPRSAGQTKWNYWKLWNLSIEGVTSSTLAPLKMATYLGFTVSFFAFLMGAFYMTKGLLFGDPVSGFPTLATLILFLGGVQLTVLGVMGEYLGRIFNETKNRPLYFANDVEPSVAGEDSMAPETQEQRSAWPAA